MKTRNFSVADLSPHNQALVRKQLEAQQKPNIAVEAPRPKYRNKRTVYRSTQGFVRTYDSILEAEYAASLDRGIAACLVKWWLPQVSIPLPGGVTYRLDFMVMYVDGRLRFIDTKGRDTQGSINKRKQVLALFGIDVEIVRK